MALSSDEVQLAVGGLHTLVEGVLDSFWRTLDLSNPAAARDALLEFVPMLVEEYGLKAASIAADWYDELRADHKLPSSFTASVGDVIEREFVTQRTRFGAQHLWDEAPGQTLAFLKDAATGYVTSAFADTIIQNTFADPEALGWARKPEAGACKFCLMLASRGGVYSSKARASKAGDGTNFHGSCRCAAVPVWADTDIAAQHGFDPNKLYEQYLNGDFD